MRKQWKQWEILFLGAPKSLQMVTAAIKLKDACFLEEKLWPRQHVKKQRHYLANKGLSSRGYGFSSGHVWMWEFDYEESWAPKNWCLWTVVLEKTLESPLDSNEIQPVHHQLPEFTQIHVHWVGDAIQPSHPLLSRSPPALNLSQHQGLFKWVSSSHQVAKILEFQLQHQSFQWTPRTDLLQDGLVGSPCSPRDSQESSPTPEFKCINSLVLSLLYITEN